MGNKMKKLILFLMVLLSVAVLGQEAEKEVFDLSDDVLTENEKNFLDFYNKHWPDERESIKRMAVDVITQLTPIADNNPELKDVIGDFSAILYGDEFEILEQAWSNGYIPNFSTFSWFILEVMFRCENLSDEIIIKCFKILYYYVNDVMAYPFPNGCKTRDYNRFYK